MTLRETRTTYGLSQIEVAALLGVPERTYRRYELDDTYGDPIKRRMFLQIMDENLSITEEKGLLSVDLIQKEATKLFDQEYSGLIDFCYLFGSYAKGTATGHSDVDLYVATSLTGLKFVGLIERLRQVLHKKVDVIRSSELVNNIDLVHEIMKGGIKIYG